MKRYDLIKSKSYNYSRIYNKRFTEGSSDVSQFISQVKCMKFKIDWDRIEREMNVYIPEEVRMQYEAKYGSNELKGSTLITILSIIGIPFAVLAAFFLSKTFVSNFSHGDHVVIDIGSFVPLLLMIFYYIILSIIDYYSVKSKLSLLNIGVIKRIIYQMKEGGIQNEDIKKAWGVAYAKAMNRDANWSSTILGGLLGMAAFFVILICIPLGTRSFTW